MKVSSATKEPHPRIDFKIVVSEHYLSAFLMVVLVVGILMLIGVRSVEHILQSVFFALVPVAFTHLGPHVIHHGRLGYAFTQYGLHIYPPQGKKVFHSWQQIIGVVRYPTGADHLLTVSGRTVLWPSNDDAALDAAINAGIAAHGVPRTVWVPTLWEHALLAASDAFRFAFPFSAMFAGLVLVVEPPYQPWVAGGALMALGVGAAYVVFSIVALLPSRIYAADSDALYEIGLFEVRRYPWERISRARMNPFALFGDVLEVWPGNRDYPIRVQPRTVQAALRPLLAARGVEGTPGA